MPIAFYIDRKRGAFSVVVCDAPNLPARVTVMRGLQSLVSARAFMNQNYRGVVWTSEATGTFEPFDA